MRKELVMVRFSHYNDAVIHKTAEVAAVAKTICYVTLNKTYRALLNRFALDGIDAERFEFVDLITPTLFKFDKSDRCVFLDSIDDLDEFAQRLLDTIKEKAADHVIFDSVSSFRVYKSDNDVVKFFNYFASFLERLDVNLTVFALEDDSRTRSVRQLKMLADETTEL